VRGFRALEAVITAMLGVIVLCYLVETILDQPDWKTLAYHAVVPRFSGAESVLLAAGILGATVMPHVIFLHSSLTQDRIVVHSPVLRRRLYRFELVDVTVAMGVAGFVNAAMLVMAAATFNRAGLGHIATIEEAYITLEPLLGTAARYIFAVSLLASGLSSSAASPSRSSPPAGCRSCSCGRRRRSAGNHLSSAASSHRRTEDRITSKGFSPPRAWRSPRTPG
jgi:manganese transport protein